MEDVLSTRVENFIKFSYIKDFVNDLNSVYENDEPLIAYKNFMEEVDLLEETKDFVEGFKNAFNGKHRAKYCEGVYINIPKFLSYKDENYNIILDSLKKIKDVFNNIEQCKELTFLKKYSQNLSSDISKIDEDNTSEKDETYLKNILDTLKPEVQKTQEEFKKQELNVDRFAKIILIGLYDKIDTVKEIDEEDSLHIKNIIKVLINTPLNLIATKKFELMKEFMCIKNISSFPVQNLIGNIKME